MSYKNTDMLLYVSFIIFAFIIVISFYFFGDSNIENDTEVNNNSVIEKCKIYDFDNVFLEEYDFVYLDNETGYCNISKGDLNLSKEYFLTLVLNNGSEVNPPK